MKRCSRHIRMAVLLCGTAFTQDGGIYQEADGLVVVEIESTHPSDGWEAETDSQGFTFNSYYRWNGGDQFSNPGAGKLRYNIALKQGGTWMLSLRNRHEHPDSTLENDVWVRANGGTWFKLYSNGPGTVGVWNWVSRFAYRGHPPASWDLPPGEHQLEFSGRSQHFKMDRFHLHLQGHPGANDETLPESVALIGASYCGPAVPNSTGQPASAQALGSTFVSNNDVTLTASDLPQRQFAMLLVSKGPGFVRGPGGSQGNLCLGGKIGRYSDDILPTTDLGWVSLKIDLTAIPTTPPKSVQPGEAYRFQFWYRDKNPSQTSNFTDGRRVNFQ